MLVLKPSFGTPSGTLASLKQQFSCFRHGGEASLRTLIRRGVSCVGCCERIWAQNLQRVLRSNECGHEQRASRKLLSFPPFCPSAFCRWLVSLLEANGEYTLLLILHRPVACPCKELQSNSKSAG